jgi:hypothetical protein
VHIGWSVRDTEDWESVELVPARPKIFFLLLTSGFAGGAPGVIRVFADVKHIASDELTDFTALGLILYVEFTYALRQSSIL